jgi:hypothetical protein
LDSIIGPDRFLPYPFSIDHPVIPLNAWATYNVVKVNVKLWLSRP